ncbi:MAG: AMP-binding protein, partial [Streptomyces sp.]|nr:AMP-binding protein [Streptomyces sp.]
MEYNLADLFESVVDVVPDREALVYADHPGTGAERRLTYAQLDAAADRIGHHLLDSGVRPGEHVGLHLYNGVEYVQTVLGCLKARIVPVNVNYRYVAEELVYLYRDADLVGLFFDAEFEDRVAAVRGRTDRLRHLVRVGRARTPSVDAVDFTEAEESGSADRGFAPRSFAPRSGDDQFIIYTGGTTGMPKGVMWRQEDLFFSGLGGGAPTGEPVHRPEELAERVAAGGSGLTFFPTPPLMHGTSTLT